MTYILFGLGCLFILLGFVDVFPKVKQSYLDAEDLYKWQKQKNEVQQAKEDLLELMEELKKVSDQAVENIESKIKEAQNIKRGSEDQLTQSRISKFNNIEVQIEAQPVRPSGTESGENVISPKNNVKKKIPTNQVTNKKVVKQKPQETTKFADILVNQLEEEKPNLDKHAYIYQLAKEGLSVEEIAQKVQVGKGEVELIIGIKRRGEHA